MTKQPYMQSLQALGTTLEFRIVVPDITEAEIIFAQLWDAVHAFENSFTRFKVKSELSQFNLHAGEKNIISRPFKKILETAKHYAEITNGLFNPFILPSLQRSGYVDSMVQNEENAPDFSSREVVAYTALEIHDDWARIPQNSAIDLGGIGKGYLADHLVNLLPDSVSGYCLSVGGDIIVKNDFDMPHAWDIHIQSHKDSEKDIAHYTSNESTFGVATSGVLRKKEGNIQEHQIDPDSKATIQGEYALCTVVASNATTADVMASTILLRGESLAKQLLEQQVIYAVFLQKDGTNEITTFGDGFEIL